MSQQPVLRHLLADMDADVRDYRSLGALLDEQFTAALRHDSARLEALAAAISVAVDALEQRRQTRVTLVSQLLPAHPRPDMATVLERLPAPARDVVAARWSTLEGLVRHCKECNAHNGRLMTDQQAILQRVLVGKDEDTYAAA